MSDGSKFKCDKCKGTGEFIIIHNISTVYNKCPVCDGKGELDWIEYARGGRPVFMKGNIAIGVKHSKQNYVINKRGYYIYKLR